MVRWRRRSVESCSLPATALWCRVPDQRRLRL